MLFFVGFLFFAFLNAQAQMEGKMTDERLLTGLPHDWEVGFQDRKGNVQTTEFVPKGQTVNNWKEMITVQTFFGGIPGQGIKGLQANISKMVKSICKDVEISNITEKNENGYPIIFWQQFCPYLEQTQKGEVTFYKAIQGNDSVYLIQKAWRTPDKEYSTVTNEDVVHWTKYLSSVSVCDGRIKGRECPKGIQ